MKSNSTEILNMLVALKANLNIKNKLNETPIHFAVRSKNIDNIDILLSQGVDLSLKTINNETPIFYSMKSGNLRIIKLLYNNNSPILNLDKNGNNEGVHAFIAMISLLHFIDPFFVFTNISFFPL